MTVRMGELESVERQRDRGLSVTVYRGGRKGSASTVDYSPDAVEQTVRKAMSIGRIHRRGRVCRAGRSRTDGAGTTGSGPPSSLGNRHPGGRTAGAACRGRGQGRGRAHHQFRGGHGLYGRRRARVCQQPRILRRLPGQQPYPELQRRRRGGRIAGAGLLVYDRPGSRGTGDTRVGGRNGSRAHDPPARRPAAIHAYGTGGIPCGTGARPVRTSRRRHYRNKPVPQGLVPPRCGRRANIPRVHEYLRGSLHSEGHGQWGL